MFYFFNLNTGPCGTRTRDLRRDSLTSNYDISNICTVTPFRDVPDVQTSRAGASLLRQRAAVFCCTSHIPLLRHSVWHSGRPHPFCPNGHRTTRRPPCHPTALCHPTATVPPDGLRATRQPGATRRPPCPLTAAVPPDGHQATSFLSQRPPGLPTATRPHPYCPNGRKVTSLCSCGGEDGWGDLEWPRRSGCVSRPLPLEDSRSHRIFLSEAPRPACWVVPRGFGGLKEGVCCRGGGKQRMGGGWIGVFRVRPPTVRGPLSTHLEHPRGPVRDVYPRLRGARES